MLHAFVIAAQADVAVGVFGFDKSAFGVGKQLVISHMVFFETHEGMPKYTT